jgi:hypothetical protein
MGQREHCERRSQARIQTDGGWRRCIGRKLPRPFHAASDPLTTGAAVVFRATGIAVRLIGYGNRIATRRDIRISECIHSRCGHAGE